MIITADDFGLSDEVTAAIVEALDRRLITHTSAMANMPAFEPACELATRKALRDHVGVHLVLTEGQPLTDAIRSCRRFCDQEGCFRYWRGEDRGFHLDASEHDAVERELRAQILRCREHGLGLPHLDSHHHVHNKRAIARIVISLARELEIPRIRLAHNCGPRISLANRVYKACFVNSRLRRAGLAGTRWYGGIEDYAHLRAKGVEREAPNSFELNLHPTYRNGELVDAAYPEHALESLLEALDLGCE